MNQVFSNRARFEKPLGRVHDTLFGIDPTAAPLARLNGLDLELSRRQRDGTQPAVNTSPSPSDTGDLHLDPGGA
jgi:hypothetical protein